MSGPRATAAGLDEVGPDSASHALMHGINPQATGHPFWAPEVLLFGWWYLGLGMGRKHGQRAGVVSGNTRAGLDIGYSGAIEISGRPCHLGCTPARKHLPFWSPELPEVIWCERETGNPWFRWGTTIKLLGAILLLLCLALPATAQTLRGPARVVDGDTLEMAGQKVRLHGIDAPELAQTCQWAGGAPWHCGWTAAVRLEELIGGRPVRCLGGERDRYKRLIARCYVVAEHGPALDLGGALVVRGLALSYRKYSSDYNSAEATAKAARAGIWAGSFVSPEEWRRGGGR